jgi:hypothetical protein
MPESARRVFACAYAICVGLVGVAGLLLGLLLSGMSSGNHFPGIGVAGVVLLVLTPMIWRQFWLAIIAAPLVALAGGLAPLGLRPGSLAEATPVALIFAVLAVLCLLPGPKQS